MKKEERQDLEQKIKQNEDLIRILENQNDDYKKQDEEQQKSGQFMIYYKSAIDNNEHNIRTMKEQIRVWKKKIEDSDFDVRY